MRRTLLEDQALPSIVVGRGDQEEILSITSVMDTKHKMIHFSQRQHRRKYRAIPQWTAAQENTLDPKYSIDVSKDQIRPHALKGFGFEQDPGRHKKSFL